MASNFLSFSIQLKNEVGVPIYCLLSKKKKVKLNEEDVEQNKMLKYIHVTGNSSITHLNQSLQNKTILLD